MTKKEFRIQRALGTLNLEFDKSISVRVTMDIENSDFSRNKEFSCKILAINTDDEINTMTLSNETVVGGETISGTFSLGVSNVDEILDMIEEQLTDD